MTTIYKKLKIAKPELTHTTLKNYESFYNQGLKYFSSDKYRNLIKTGKVENPIWNPKSFFKSIPETTRYLDLHYEKINVKLTKYNCWVAVCLSFNKVALSKSVKALKNKIEEDLKLKSKRDIESRVVNQDESGKDYFKIFDEIKKSLTHQAELVDEIYETDKTSYTIIELKQINKYAFMSIIASSFLLDEDKLLFADNPPRRLDYRFLKYKIGRNLSDDFNYLNKINNKLNIFRLVFNKYKKTAWRSLGQQTLNINKDLLKILKLYIHTHKNIRKSDILFPQNLYNLKDEKVYEGYQFSKIIKKYFGGYTIDDIRHAFVSRAYNINYIPSHEVLKGLSYRMSHSFKTAMSHYRQLSKIKI